MGAFNRRLEPKELSGMPLEAVVALVFALIFGTFTMLAPWAVKPLLGAFVLAALVTAFYAFKYRDVLPFLVVIIQGRYIEPGRVTSETRTKE